MITISCKYNRKKYFVSKNQCTSIPMSTGCILDNGYLYSQGMQMTLFDAGQSNLMG